MLNYIFYNDRLLLRKEGNGRCRVPDEEEVPRDLCTSLYPSQEVVLPNGTTVRATSISRPIEEDDNWMMPGLRASFDYLPYAEYRAGGKAFQILYWDKHSRFCPVCGTPTEQQGPIMKRCPACGYEIYPPISTAIIVLIRRGKDEVLLVHARNFRGTFYGLVAGFLEPGETLEQCVEREVREETSLSIRNLTYFDSQPWPYPSGLMVGFMADYAGGTIKLQDDELSAGAFYHRDHLPELPQKLSIARRLIDHWLETKDYSTSSK